MNYLKLTFLSVIFIATLSCQKGISYPPERPTTKDETDNKDLTSIDYGDFRIDASELSAKGASGFQAYSSKAWKKGVVPVKFHSSISKANQDLFYKACQAWGKVAKVSCRAKGLFDSNYLYVTNTKAANRCWTELGAGASGGERVFNFAADWCWNSVSLLHELGHVLGLMHEHQRPDRDLYIQVFPENAGEMAYSYDKLSLGAMDNSGPYDFYSIMHYWNAAYSVNGKLIMVPRPGFEKYASIMGRATTLSAGDQTLIQKIYGVR